MATWGGFKIGVKLSVDLGNAVLILIIRSVPYSPEEEFCLMFSCEFCCELGIGGYTDVWIIFKCLLDKLHHLVNGKVAVALLAVVANGNDDLIEQLKPAFYDIFMALCERIK